MQYNTLAAPPTTPKPIPLPKPGKRIRQIHYNISTNRFNPLILDIVENRGSVDILVLIQDIKNSYFRS